MLSTFVGLYGDGDYFVVVIFFIVGVNAYAGYMVKVFKAIAIEFIRLCLVKNQCFNHIANSEEQ